AARYTDVSLNVFPPSAVCCIHAVAAHAVITIAHHGSASAASIKGRTYQSGSGGWPEADLPSEAIIKLVTAANNKIDIRVGESDRIWDICERTTAAYRAIAFGIVAEARTYTYGPEEDKGLVEASRVVRN